MTCRIGARRLLLNTPGTTALAGGRVFLNGWARCRPEPLPRCGADQLHVLFEQLIEELVERDTALLGAGGQEVQHLWLQAQRRDQAQVGPVELAALGVAEIVLVFHKLTPHPSSYCLRSAGVASRAEIKRTSAVFAVVGVNV